VTLTVGFDAHMIQDLQTGNEVCAWGVLQGLAALEDRPRVVVYEATQLPLTGFVHRRVSAGGNFRRLLAELPSMARRDQLNVLHSTYVAPPRSPVPVVLTIHDVTYLSNPEWFSRRDLLVLTLGVGLSVRRAAHVLTGSEAARAQILARYRLDPARVTATPYAAGPAAEAVPEGEAAAIRAGLRLERPYVVSVGGGNPRKNMGRLVAAFGLLRREGFEGELVIAGAAGRLAASALPGGVRLVGQVGPRTMAALYQGAAACAVPALEEGFGVPTLEALSHGVSVAASDIPVLREVAGEAALYFDPRDPASIATALGRAVAEDRATAGRGRAAQFSWRRTAERTVAAYREVTASA
jgi:glycosyltransferase involved in cell wall biosynthesis